MLAGLEIGKNNRPLNNSIFNTVKLNSAIRQKRQRSITLFSKLIDVPLNFNEKEGVFMNTLIEHRDELDIFYQELT